MGQYKLELPTGVTADSYTIGVGLYHWETHERLPVWDERGQRVIDDGILLTPRG
jgi:hypothetical protein